MCAAFVINRCPTNHDFIPYERWHKKNFDYSKLRAFGCDALMLTYEHNSDKFRKRVVS